MKKKQTIAIINLNTPELVECCILSIRKQGCEWPIVVFDNSQDLTLPAGDGLPVRTIEAHPFKKRMKGVKVITITENTDSPLALGADVVIKQYVNRETDKYNCQGTTSSVSLAVIFHVLQTALIEETDFQNERFAIVHPGGAVGERLNKK